MFKYLFFYCVVALIFLALITPATCQRRRKRPQRPQRPLKILRPQQAGKPQKPGRQYRQFMAAFGKYEDYIPCSEYQTVAKEFAKWNSSSEFQFYVPKSSCFVCFKPPCPPSGCPSLGTSEKMVVYNNLFEFGLFSFNLPDRNYFRIAHNRKCYFKVEVTPRKAEKEICVTIHECEFSALQDNNCSTTIYGTNKTDADFTKECIMIALAFVDPDRVHYSITFDCTYIPSTLLSDNKTMAITSKNCYFNKATDTPVVEYDFTDNRDKLPNGVSLILPCNPGGYVINETTGRFVHGDSCGTLVRNESEDVGFDFVIQRIYNGSEDLLFPTLEKDLFGLSSLLPLYLSRTKKWKSYQEMKPIVQFNPEFENKIRQGCKILEAPPSTPPPPPPTLPPLPPVPPVPPVEPEVPETTVITFTSLRPFIPILPSVDSPVEPIVLDFDLGENRDLDFDEKSLLEKVEVVRNETPQEAELSGGDIACGIIIMVSSDVKIFTVIINYLGMLFFN